MHPDDAGAERAVPRKSADAHRRQPDGRPKPLGKRAELLRGVRADDAAAAAEEGALGSGKHRRGFPQSGGVGHGSAGHAARGQTVFAFFFKYVFRHVNQNRPRRPVAA